MQIENHALRFRENTQSKCGAFDYLDHQPGGGNVKVYSLALLLYIKYMMICFHKLKATLLHVIFAYLFVMFSILVPTSLHSVAALQF